MKKPPSGREPTKKVKHSKSRKTSSNLWLERHINDPYVHKAQREGYRSRAAYKLKEIDEKYKFLKTGLSVVDLGSAPGGWCQVAIEKKCAPIVAIDLLEMDHFPEVTFLQMDFTDGEAPTKLKQAIGGKADVVLSDMAPNTTGHRQTDHIRIIGLVEMAYEFALEILKPNGVFLCKVFQGGTETILLNRIKKDFATVRHVKPPASRQESAEAYLLATGFRG
jgi:23S rRNA (uridine2552-2'-O)-methyltransferase